MKERNPLVTVILITSFAIGASLLTRGHFWGDDFASYIMQAQSILHGNMREFVERNTITIFQSSFQLGPVAYPWGYPLILAPVRSIFGLSPLALKFPALFFFTGFLICLFLLIKNCLTRTESLILVSLFAFNPTLLHALDLILSDIPFLFFSTLTLLLMTKRKVASSLLENILFGVVVFFAYFIRTNGSLLLLSFLAYQALRFYREPARRKNIIIDTIIVSFVFSLLWFTSSLIFPNGQDSYIKQLGDFSYATFTRNLSGYFALFGEFWGENTAWTMIYYLLLPFFFIGLWIRRNVDRPLIIFFAIYLPFMIIWPEWQGLRFIYPVLPIFIYLVFQGMIFATGKLGSKQDLGRYAIHVFWLAIVAVSLYSVTRDAYLNLKGGRSINGPFDPYSIQVYDFIKDKTPSDSVVVFFKPRAMRLMTNHDTLMLTECNRLPEGDYVVISKKAENSQIPPEQIDECNVPLDQVFENRKFIIYRMRK